MASTSDATSGGHVKCELVYRLVGTAVRCDVCNGKTLSSPSSTSTAQKMRPWMSCVQCDYDECLACFFKRMTNAVSLMATTRLSHAHETSLFVNNSPKVVLECSVCYKKVPPSHLRHHYCSTCNTMDQMNKWYICCKKCAHQSADIGHPPLAKVMELAAKDIGDEHFLVPSAPPFAPSVDDDDDGSNADDATHGTQLRVK